MPIENNGTPTKEELAAKMKSLAQQYQTIRTDKVAQLKGQKTATPAPSTENAAPTKEQGSLQQGAKQQAAPMKSAAPVVEKEAGKPTPEAEGKNLMQAFQDLKKGGYSGKQPLGCLSKQFESGLDKSVETVSSGKGDPGGVSYGIYQMASKVKGEVSHKSTAGVFVAKHYPKDFGNLMPGSAEFSAVWKKVSQREAERFAGMQHQFIQATHFDPKVKALLDSTGVDINQRSRPLQDAVWSTCVQHGKALDILTKAFNSAGNAKASDKQLIEAIYKVRTAFVAHLRDNAKNPGDRKTFENIIANRYPQELKNALKGLSNAGETPAPTSEAGKDATNGETTNKGNNPTDGKDAANSHDKSTTTSEAVDKDGNPTDAKDATHSETHAAPKGDGKTLSAPVGENCPNNPDDVTLVQTLLNKQGFKIGIDGKFGDETAKAITDFQHKAGLAVQDGVIEPNKNAWKALNGAETKETTSENNNTTAPASSGNSSMESLAKQFGLEVAVILAIKDVESGGKGYLKDGRPKILFEGHVFWKELKQAGKNPATLQKGNEDILYPTWDKSKYAGGAGEYPRLEKAMAIDKIAALKSASWGEFQILGNNHKLAGYPDVESFVEAIKTQGENNSNLMALLNFLKNNNLLKFVQGANKNWAGLARGYNGKAYKKNQYDTKLEAAYNKHKK